MPSWAHHTPDPLWCRRAASATTERLTPGWTRRLGVWHGRCSQTRKHAGPRVSLSVRRLREG
jgi:hypothetical protein